MKTIVTHLSPDLDSVVCCWLIKKYIPGWRKAEIMFVSSGSTLKNQSADSNPEIIHVDTGYGKFDHHHLSENTSASKLILDFLKHKKYINKKDFPALERLIELVSFVDNFGECQLPDASNDFYDLGIHQIIEGLKNIFIDNIKIFEFGFTLIEAVLVILKKKILAEKEIKNGYIFKSIWGDSLALETTNDESVHLAQKLGFVLVIRKDPEKGWVRIKVRPDSKFGLEKVYTKVKTIDPKANWFFHASRRMLLNGSGKNPDVIPSHLSLKKIIEIVKGI